MKFLFAILLCFYICFARCQQSTNNLKNSNLSKYLGKYSTQGMIVQVAKYNDSLMLIVPGAPLQPLIPIGGNKFRTNSFNNEIFVFVTKRGKIESLLSKSSGQSLSLQKISNTPDIFNQSDSLLNNRKTTDHFSFLYSSIDSISIINISMILEKSYAKVLSDFRLESIPVTTVRIYPDLANFHKGINFPNAPDNLLATAFGKSDFRMASPNSAGSDSLMLMKGIVHEFTHCVHLNIDYSPNNPKWLWEGVAMYEAGWFMDPKEIAEVKEKKVLHLRSLNNGMEYMLGFVVIEAIKEIWSFDAVISLIKKRGDIQAVLQISEKEFEDKIFGHIYKKYMDE